MEGMRGLEDVAEAKLPIDRHFDEGWQTGFEPATAGTTSRSSTN
jgi:hypothetical protein